MRTARDGAHALHEALTEQGGTVAGTLKLPAADAAGLDRPGPAQLAATGPRARGNESEYELLLEMILEGYRLHYDDPVVVHTPDLDLALLLGDQLYALGLSRLAALGDLDAVAELADVISLAAQARTASDAELAGAIWDAGAASVGWGASAAHADAKARARAHDPGATEALRAVACAVRIESPGPTL
ncbi:MAG TPA: hypothetical protein VMB27_18260 [Solirubrobacteraceae bacterium]|nr:hypothetical protein [Solirubrobacteraceae bacterium]